MSVKQQITTVLEKHKQQHLTKALDSLENHKKKTLLAQVSHINALLAKETLGESRERSAGFLKPLLKCSVEELLDGETGEKWIKEGTAGCVLLAGGEGSRLNFSKPKGMFPIGPLKNKSLFQICAEKLLATQNKYQIKLYLAVMVNPISSNQIISFFKQNHFFGLEEDQVDFFQQEMLPFFDKEGKWFWGKKGKIAEGTEGNGGVFQHFMKSVIFNKWKALGIQDMSIVPIDNPIAPLFEEKMIGLHKRNKADITYCAIPFEEEKKMGGFAYEGGHVRVVEYVYLHKKLIPIAFSNTGLYLVSLSYIESMYQYPMPFHKVKKNTKKWTEGKRIDFLAYKYEKFIFDAFNFSRRTCVYKSSKERCFSPLKDKEDIEKVQKALLDQSKNINPRE